MNITCTIETLYGDSVIDVESYSRNIEFTFVKGHAYNFILTLQNPGDVIEFTVTAVNEWIPGEDDLPNMDNQQESTENN